MAYRYMEKYFPKGSIVYYDHNVGVPDRCGFKSYHYWQHTGEELLNTHPDYVVYDSNHLIREKKTIERELLEQVIKKNNGKNIIEYKGFKSLQSEEYLQCIQIWECKKTQ